LPYQRRIRRSCESKKRTGRARTKRTRIKNHSRIKSKKENTGIKKETGQKQELQTQDRDIEIKRQGYRYLKRPDTSVRSFEITFQRKKETR
jgi:hypothetical protein